MGKFLSMETFAYFWANKLKPILDSKVNAISGKGLSSNDFTNADKAAIDSLEDSVVALRSTKLDKTGTAPSAIKLSEAVMIGNAAFDGTQDISIKEIGVRPDTWIPTVEEVGARPDDWIPTAEEVGARPDDWIPTAEEVGARPNTWTPSAADVGATPANTAIPKVGGATEGDIPTFNASGALSDSGVKMSSFTRAKMTLSGTTLTITTVS